MPDRSDGELLEAYRCGERDAFTALVLRHQSTLLRHARALLGPGSAYEDAVQECFLRLAQHPPVLASEVALDARASAAQLVSWLHKVTRNCCMDVMRSEGRRKRREREVAAEESADGGLKAVDGRDTRAAVERELASLPVDQREVLVLRLLNDRSYREIAEITGKKVGTVGWLISVGLKALSERLAPVLSGVAPSAVTELGGADGRFAPGELS